MDSSRADYFSCFNVKTPRPWFHGVTLPRCNANLIIRLRTSQFCTGNHFIRIGWNLPAGCDCSAELYGELTHLLYQSPLLVFRRLMLLRYINRNSSGSAPDLFDIRDIAFITLQTQRGELGCFFGRVGVLS